MKEATFATDQMGKVFSLKEVIKSCRRSINQGIFYGFHGRNGTEKTTALKLNLGFLKPSSGTASVLGTSFGIRAMPIFCAVNDILYRAQRVEV